MSPEYTSSIYQGQNTTQAHKVQKSIKPWIEKKEQKLNTVTQFKRVLKKGDFKI